YRSYMSHARRYLPRHRGKSPHQIAYFTRSLRMQEETAVLASVLSLLGVVPASAGAATPVAVPGLGRGELLCQAFEAYRLLLPAAQISFEHAVFLPRAARRGARGSGVARGGSRRPGYDLPHRPRHRAAAAHRPAAAHRLPRS